MYAINIVNSTNIRCSYKRNMNRSELVLLYDALLRINECINHDLKGHSNLVKLLLETTKTTTTQLFKSSEKDVCLKLLEPTIRYLEIVLTSEIDRRLLEPTDFTNVIIDAANTYFKNKRTCQSTKAMLRYRRLQIVREKKMAELLLTRFPVLMLRNGRRINMVNVTLDKHTISCSIYCETKKGFLYIELYWNVKSANFEVKPRYPIEASLVTVPIENPLTLAALAAQTLAKHWYTFDSPMRKHITSIVF